MVSLCGRGFDSLQLHPRNKKKSLKSQRLLFLHICAIEYPNCIYAIEDFYFLKLSRYFSGDMWRCSRTYFPKKEVLEKPRMPEISLIDFVVERR